MLCRPGDLSSSPGTQLQTLVWLASAVLHSNSKVRGQDKRLSGNLTFQLVGLCLGMSSSWTVEGLLAVNLGNEFSIPKKEPFPCSFSLDPPPHSLPTLTLSCYSHTIENKGGNYGLNCVHLPLMAHI